ncbi:hypothetical protein BH11MYX3_BH11MYX3_21910 [soil metagenome]
MIRGVLLGVVSIAGCDRRTEPPPAPPPVGSAAELPDPLNLDWQSLRYDLGSLGVVKATGGRAVFRILEDDSGLLHATQAQDPAADAAGFLDLDPPTLVDLDGDQHEESVIPFELKSSQDSVFGAFVFTLRDGNPVQLATIPTTKKAGFTVDGAAIKTVEGVRWAWNPTSRKLESH